ncbi:hypothetical protein T440DRAFT_539773 [Plenodomus tracheiphilus IPT5]|uniref:Uncharacterized protein n=1 Tax=Plenodomus tracheiphilus IPT5 TaxID=1408161 RepID=A0A6A7AYU7_9PLEO|nr:hypothetical protein T440DRAFT_539773 [Plenodomus tracheiphilus IPT5]
MAAETPLPGSARLIACCTSHGDSFRLSIASCPSCARPGPPQTLSRPASGRAPGATACTTRPRPSSQQTSRPARSFLARHGARTTQAPFHKQNSWASAPTGREPSARNAHSTSTRGARHSFPVPLAFASPSPIRGDARPPALDPIPGCWCEIAIDGGWRFTDGRDVCSAPSIQLVAAR